MSRIFILLGVIFLSSCNLKPQLSVPPPEIDDDLITMEKGEIQRTPFSEVFESKELQKLIELGLENNKDIKISILNIAAAKNLYRIERAELLPEFNASISASRYNITENQSRNSELNVTSGKDTIISEYSANLASGTLEPDLFGKLRNINEIALQKYLSTQYNADFIKITYIADLAAAYLQLLSDKKLLALTNDTLNTQQESYDIINAAYENGLVSALDLSQINIALQSAKADKNLYERLIELDKNLLVQLLAIKAQDLPEIDYEMENLQINIDAFSHLSSKSLLRRPDIRQAEAELRAANAQIGVARSAFFPVISLTASYGFASSELNNLFSGGSLGAWSFAPNLTLPIFKAGQNIAGLKYSAINKEIAIENYQKTVQNAFKEVTDQIINQEYLHKQLNSQEELVNATQKTYDISQQRYHGGIDNFLTVLDAQRSLFASRKQQILIEQQIALSLINFYKAAAF